MVEHYVANVDVASSSLVSRSILLLVHIYYVGIEKKLEVLAELFVLGMAMFLAAFFCFRTALLPPASPNTINKIYEVKETLRQK